MAASVWGEGRYVFRCTKDVLRAEPLPPSPYTPQAERSRRLRRERESSWGVCSCLKDFTLLYSEVDQATVLLPCPLAIVPPCPCSTSTSLRAAQGLRRVADSGDDREGAIYVPDVSVSVGCLPMTVGGDVTPRPRCY
ncbi:hypothetical protein E2C01_099697 [Portunus trituberculatus]|uniref:Uncharacterized protein n=1 Tax=Portunus trituberculatus TaxID=210409 RepID=A0A5B7KG11_PORTR|nr:hypothetical protein [Portunus trituberculatus]